MHMAQEQKQKQDTLRKHLNSLYRTEKEVGVLTSLCQQARWFVREKREEKYIKMLYGQFTRSKKLKSGMLLRTFMLVDKLLKQYRSFRQHIATVIVQMFVELFSIFFESDSFAEVFQLKRLRKRWVMLLPDEVLSKIQSTIKKRFGFDVDSGFSEANIQELREYYTKELKLPQEQIGKYLPKVKVKAETQRKSVERSSESKSPVSQERATKRAHDDFGGSSQAPQGKSSQYQAGSGAVSAQNPQYDAYQKRPMIPPHPGYAEHLPPGYPPNPQAYYYPTPMPPPNGMVMPPQYMQYPQQPMGYHGGYYQPGPYPVDMYYQPPTPQQQQQKPPTTPYHGDFYKKMYDDRQQPPPQNEYDEMERIQRQRIRQKERQRERILQQQQQLKFANTATEPSYGRSKPQQPMQQSSLSAREKLQELRLGSLRCPRCGLQSAQRESFDVHLKSHFQQSRRAYEIVRKNGPTSRMHLPDAQQWLEQLSEQNYKEYFVEMKLAHDKTCRLCAGEFSPSWDAKLEKWVYRGVASVKMNDNEGTFHYDCYKALQSELPNGNDV